MQNIYFSLLIVGLVATGFAAIIFASDARGRTSRALALCLALIGADLLINVLGRMDGHAPGLWTEIGSAVLESLSIYAGIEWARRIGETSNLGRRSVAVNVLYRVAQGFAVLFGLMRLGYLWLAPDLATQDGEGIVRTSGLEFALFAPLVGVSMLLATIATLILLFSHKDPAELARLRALAVASPFLLAGLIGDEIMVAVSLTLGLLLFLYGSIRYLMIQHQRGQFMSQFLSPEVTRMMRAQGGEDALRRRERRRLSVVVCDIRGFTAYARKQDSDGVVTLLEAFYKAVGQVTNAHRGTVKDHAGDGILILVGAPVQLEEHASVALALAQDIMLKARPLLRTASDELGLGVGVATGNTTIGAIQGAGRLEYVAVGNAVNLAARLCQRAADGEILLDEGTKRALGGNDALPVQPRAPEPLKGFAEPVPVYAIAQ